MRRRTITWLALPVTAVIALACSSGGGGNWYRGNTHMHSLWSDGDAAPEAVVDWYVTHGFDFLALTDHNIIQEGERWVTAGEGGRVPPDRLEALRSRFGDEWVVLREVYGRQRMRLKTLDELRARFEAPGAFLMISGEEISDTGEGKPLHFNALNLGEVIPTLGGGTIEETMERNLDAVKEQAARLGRHIAVHINHTNWKWALTPEQLAGMRGTHLFEVYNGSTGCNNYGDETHPGMDEVWDIALTLRLTRLGYGLLYGVATDDTHNYFTSGPEFSTPGRGWIVVRAARLATEDILTAIEEGDFYASTGVTLEDIRIDRAQMRIVIEEENGLTYTTRFIGTRLIGGEAGEPGVVLMETTENPAVYRFDGDELYVRARVTSSRMMSNYALGEEAPEQAWVQPVIPGGR